MAERNELEDARYGVLAETTAQAIHNHLVKLFREESRFRSRWVWELLQNASDAAPHGGVRVWLVREQERLLFRHNGLPFTDKDIAHLIYSGSTKHDLSGSDPIGQFGTGFLTTHLISKTVTVKGRTKDGRRFCFLLDRRGNTAEKLERAISGSWEEFGESLAEAHASEEPDFSTEYAYPLDEGSVGIVEQGINDLIANAAYLLAFNERIQSLEVALPDRKIRVEKKGSHPIGEQALRFDFEERTGDGNPVMRHVAVISSGGTSTAVELARPSTQWQVVERKDTPRIFVAFPLTATRDFCLPVVVNNEKFQPGEDRDTLFLKEDRDGKPPNMTLMEGACDLAARLAILAAAEDRDHAASLAGVGALHQWVWLDAEWFRLLLDERFIEPLRQAEIMVTACGQRISPLKGCIPVPVGAESCHDVWNVVSQLRGAAQRLPRCEEAQVWAENLTNWARFLGKTPEQFQEGLTLDKLCGQVSKWGTVATIQQQLTESVDALDWLDRLHGLVSKADREHLFDHLLLIPNQCGMLKKITELRRDGGINEGLKDIAESLGLTVRADLVDKRMRLRALEELQPKTESEVLAEALQKLKEKAKGKPLDSAFRSTNVQFFVWLVRNDHLDQLDGFPALTRATTDEEVGLPALSRDPTKPDETLLAPTGCWPEAARIVADLFPKRQTLSDAYREALDDDAAWRGIEGKGFVRLSPLYKTQRRGIPFIPDEPLPELGKEKKQLHRTKDAVELSALAFFEKGETGLDAVRHSKPRAASLLLFLADYVLEEDVAALDTFEADCECGEKHRYFRAAWLVPMWENQWVPLGGNKQSWATAETIAQLFEGRDKELRRLTTGKGRSLLEALKISLADLSLRAVAKDEETRISLIGSLSDIVHAASNNAERVLRLIAEEIRELPAILDQIRERRERREKVRQNQWVGTEVERLLKEALDGRGLKVSRTGIGSDFKVEQDHVVGDEEVLFAIENGTRSFFIEVKATSGSEVRMTITQAKTAAAKKDRFALCIVQLEGSAITPEAVRGGCRFIMDIGHRIEPMLGEYQQYQNAKEKACTSMGDVELVMTDAEIRFVVSTKVCGTGLAFDDIVAHLSTVASSLATVPHSPCKTL